MKRLLFLTLLLVASALRAEELPVVLNGQYRDPVNAYKIGSAYFLNAKEAGQLYGGQVYWYPVSGRVQLSIRGRAIQLQVDGDSVQVGDKMVKLDSAVMLRTSQAYIPLSFFEGDEFSGWAGMDTTFNPRTKLLTLDRRSTVGEARWFSYKDYTRVAVELSPRVSYKAAARGVGGVEVSFPLGTIDGSEQQDIGDGVLDYYALTQGAQSAKLAVKFSKPGLKWRAKELSDPRRVVLDVFKAEPVATAEGQEGTAAAPASHEAPAETSQPAVSVAPSSSEPLKSSQPASSLGPVVEGQVPEHVKRRIVVDAGHGGKDPGATGARGTQEKDINLRAALELAKLLKQEGTFEVLLTRADDTFVPLSDRSRMANEFGADLFVSLHCNASPHPRDNGFEVYFMSEHATDPAAQELADRENSSVELEGKTTQDAQAELLLMEMSKTENINSASELAALTARDMEKRVDIADNGVKQAGFYVLRGTHAPAILFEMAYISNKKDEAKLQSKKYRRRLVDGVYAGVLDYAKRQGWLDQPGHGGEMKTRRDRPIGVFDSGLGGLTVFKALARRMPEESLLYFGDTAHVPYGNKSKEAVTRYSTTIAKFLAKQGVKALVVACNTSTALALPAIAKAVDVPVIGVIEGGVRAASGRRIGVIGTEATVKSRAYQDALKKALPGATVVAQACPLLVPLVEEGWWRHKVTTEVAREYLKPLLAKKVDAIILGCTHYPLLKDTLQKVAGPRVKLVDSAEETAIATDRRLTELGLRRTRGAGRREYYASDAPDRFRRLSGRFLGAPVRTVRLHAFDA